MIRTFLCSLAVFGFAIGMAPHAVASTIQVTLIETIEFDPNNPDSTSNWGWYTLAAIDLDGNTIVGFAVDNSVSEFAEANRPGWGGAVVDRETWNAGYSITFNGFYAGLPPETKSTGPAPGFGGFDTIFDQVATRANFYWLATDEGVPIVEGETAGGPFIFFFMPAVAESTLVLFLRAPDGSIFASTAAPAAAVPEPATLALIGASLGPLIAARSRRHSARRVASSS